MASVFGPLDDRVHHHAGEQHGERDEELPRRRRLRADRRAEEVQDDQDPR